jgi:nucleotide-binding universal stress UspA family protein
MVFAVKSKVNAEELVKEVAAKFTAEGIPVDTKTAEGDIVDDIIAMSGMYDLVVMGTEGRKGLKKILNGSVAEHVMTHALCPVTIVRDT